MTLSSTLSNALTGLTASSRSAELVSSNIANAMTDGYARREIQLSSQSNGTSGAGVKVDGVTRVVDERVLADRRQAEAAAADYESRADAWMQIQDAIGVATESGSLLDDISSFEAALVEASSRPDEQSRLDEAVSAAVSIADQINAISDEIQTLRMDADSDIAAMVDQLNADLQRVETLNHQIFQLQEQGRDASSLLDERQRTIDSISTVIPVQQISRDGGQIALFTGGGAVLLDGTAGELGFEAVGVITPYMSVEAGTLSGLTLNGNTLNVGSSFDPIAGGALSAAFAVRDEIAPAAQAGLDGLARDLVERFQDSSLDTTISVGGAGLFTDDGSAFSAIDETGLASRIAVNAAVDPEQGGESWRLRDGLEAASVGAEGDATLLNALADRLSEESVVSSGYSAGMSRSMTEVASDFLSQVSTSQLAAEDDRAYQMARYDALVTEEGENGVNTDDEMQKLLLIEQAYAANARVIQAVEEMMDQLLGI